MIKTTLNHLLIETAIDAVFDKLVANFHTTSAVTDLNSVCGRYREIHVHQYGTYVGTYYYCQIVGTYGIWRSDTDSVIQRIDFSYEQYEGSTYENESQFTHESLRGYNDDGVWGGCMVFSGNDLKSLSFIR